MKVRRTKKVTIQTNETLVLRPSQVTVLAHCAQCAAEVEMLTAGAAASRVGVPLRSIYRAVEAGRLHFLETSAGLVLVCPNSLHRTNQLPAAEPGSHYTPTKEN